MWTTRSGCRAALPRKYPDNVDFSASDQPLIDRLTFLWESPVQSWGTTTKLSLTYQHTPDGYSKGLGEHSDHYNRNAHGTSFRSGRRMGASADGLDPGQ